MFTNLFDFWITHTLNLQNSIHASRIIKRHKIRIIR